MFVVAVRRGCVMFGVVVAVIWLASLLLVVFGVAVRRCGCLLVVVRRSDLWFAVVWCCSLCFCQVIFEVCVAVVGVEFLCWLLFAVVGCLLLRFFVVVCCLLLFVVSCVLFVVLVFVVRLVLLVVVVRCVWIVVWRCVMFVVCCVLLSVVWFCCRRRCCLLVVVGCR